jgi:hypothetical protein
MTENNKILNLRSFDIVLINYVEESKKDDLLNELKGLYGEYKPLETGLQLARDSSRSSPDSRLGKRIIYYDDVNNLKKALPEKFESLEIRIVNHITSWCEVICKGRLKRKYLQRAEEEFLERIDRENTVSIPKTFEDAHKELENYLSPHIMDNIIHKQDSEKRRSYPYLYIGEVGALSSKNLMEIIEKTDYTRSGIGWLGLRWGSIIERRYLVEQMGGGHSGLIFQNPGVSILNISPINRSENPSSWDDDTIRKFRATSFEYHIIDTISLILFTNVLFTYRLERIKDWEKEILSLSSKMKELSDKFDWEAKNDEDSLKEIIDLENEVVRLRSAFIGKSFDLRNECEELDNIIKFSFEYLLSRGFNNFPIEEPFFNPIDAEEDFIEDHVRSGNPKKGVLLNVIEGSQYKNEELLKKINKIEEEQRTLTSYIHDILNINLQINMKMLAEKNLSLSKSVNTLTKWIVAFTIVMILLILMQMITKSHLDVIWNSVYGIHEAIKLT